MDGEEEIQRDIFSHVTDFYFMDFPLISFGHLSQTQRFFWKKTGLTLWLFLLPDLKKGIALHLN